MKYLNMDKTISISLRRRSSAQFKIEEIEQTPSSDNSPEKQRKQIPKTK